MIDPAYYSYIAYLCEDDLMRIQDYFARKGDKNLTGNDDAESYLYDFHTAIDILNNIGNTNINMEELQAAYEDVVNTNFGGHAWFD